jgi:periplasmic copper chaperone A
MKRLLLTALFALGLAPSAFACNLQFDNAWVRPTLAGKNATAAFMDITNIAETDCTLTSVLVEGAVAEIHNTVEEDGTLKMRKQSSVVIPAGKTVHFKPGGLHIMLMEIPHPVTEGATALLSLFFADKTSMALPVQVGQPKTAPTAPEDSHHH